jgi:hypothetical protein
MRAIDVVMLLLATAVARPAGAEDGPFAVLPTHGAGGVTAEAEMASTMMRLALQEQSVAQVPAAAVQASADGNETACQQSAVACARLVGRETGATLVVASELWSQGGTLELRLAVVDVRAGGVAGHWQSFTARDKAALGRVAQHAVLALVAPQTVFGRLTVVTAPGAEVLVDGVARDRTPMLAPLELSVGRHELEVRYGRLTPWRGFVEISMDTPTVLPLCERDGALTDACGDATSSATTTPTAPTPSPKSAPPGLRGPLSVGGVVGVGVGAVGVVVGTLAAGAAGAALEDFADGEVTAAQRDDALAAQGLAAGSFVVGGVALAAGAAALTASLWME